MVVQPDLFTATKTENFSLLQNGDLVYTRFTNRDVVAGALEFLKDFVLRTPDVAGNVDASWFGGPAFAGEISAIRRTGFDVDDLAHLAGCVFAVPNPDAGKRNAIAVTGISNTGNTRTEEIVIPEVLDDVGKYVIQPRGWGSGLTARKVAEPVFDKAKAVERTREICQQGSRRSAVATDSIDQIGELPPVKIKVMRNGGS